MPHRQVVVIDPETGYTVWTYEDLGAGAAKPAHGNQPAKAFGAVGLGKFVVPKHNGVSSTRKATK